MTDHQEKGQVSLTVALITSAGMIIAAAFTGWFSAANRVGMAETKISVVEERENNHFLELSKSIEKIDKKLDILLNVKNQPSKTP